MRKLILCALGVVAPTFAFAQAQPVVVPACAPAYMPVAQPGQPYPPTVDPNGNQCVVAAGQPAPPGPVFVVPGPPTLNRWRQSCQCFTNPP